MAEAEAQHATRVHWWEGDWWKRLVDQFWYLRGVAAAIAIANFVPLLVDLSRWEFLRAFHALMVRWNAFAAWLGHMLGALLFLPPLSSALINSLVLVSSVLGPFAFGVPWPHHRKVNVVVGIVYFIGLSFVALPDAETMLRESPLLVLGVSAMAIGALLLVYAGIKNSTTVTKIASSSMKMGLLLVSVLFFSIIFADRSPSINVAFFVAIIGMLMLFAVALASLRGYARGLVTVIGFVIALEALYYLNTPFLSDWINNTASSALTNDPQDRTQ